MSKNILKVKLNILQILLVFPFLIFAQHRLNGEVSVNGKPMAGIQVSSENGQFLTQTLSDGSFSFENIPSGNLKITASFPGLISQTKVIQIPYSQKIFFNLKEENILNEVVVSGTMKAVTRDESPVPVEVYSAGFFKKNPTPNIFEGLQTVNGVRPQFNCNICNTGDIHINGLEGPYTLVLIDGMPMVSGLSTVYGLSGIPNSLVDRIEIVKGPASSLYGSEAVGGLINIITKHPKNAPLASVDIFTTSWGETNVDASYNFSKDKFSVLTGLNFFHYSKPIDNNKDRFTDVTLSDRISVFQKWNFQRKSEKQLSFMNRFFYEDRWGGQLGWNSRERGLDNLYGESIYTQRWESIGMYELPTTEKLKLQYSYTYHNQNSYYGTTPYMATQQIAFAQLLWDKKISNHDLLLGGTFRYQYYNDNTPATQSADRMKIPGIFIQDDIKLHEKHQLLLGARFDYNNYHGSIFTPRLAYRFQPGENTILRLNSGTGFRVVNLFTEDHAALSGAREVIIKNDLKPEKSWNINANLLQKIPLNPGLLTFELTGWYTHFSNSILPDYESNPTQIIYDNLNGHAVTQGASLNVDLLTAFGIKANIGATYMDVSRTENGEKNRQFLTERFSGTWNISYDIPSWNLSVDYTGNLYGPMKLPLASALDPRPANSPTYSIQNIQFTLQKFRDFDIYFGIKNLLNWTPDKHAPFLIGRAHDPFNQQVQYDSNGGLLATQENPYAMQFDASYMYAPNQGIRTFVGLRYTFR